MNRIGIYFHCKYCFDHNLGQHLAAGWTKEGLQVICETCNNIVIDLDFMGQKIAYYKENK